MHKNRMGILGAVGFSILPGCQRSQTSCWIVSFRFWKARGAGIPEQLSRIKINNRIWNSWIHIFSHRLKTLIITFAIYN